MNKSEIVDLFRNKKQPKSEIQDTKITNLIELQDLVKRLANQTTDKTVSNITIDSKGTNLSDAEFKGNITIPQSDNGSVMAKTLLEGFETVKKHQEFAQSSKIREEDVGLFGGYIPAISESENQLMWVDQFIQKRMGGKRIGLHVIWEIPEGTYRLDPWTYRLEKVQ